MIRRIAMMLWKWSEPEEYYAYCFWLVRQVEAEYGVDLIDRLKTATPAQERGRLLYERGVEIAAQKEGQ